MKQITVSPADLPYQLVNFGIDTLVLNVRYENDEKQKKLELPESIVEQLNVLQAQAKEQEEPIATSYIFRGENLFIHPHGAGKGQWRWLLTSSLFNVCVSRGRLGGVVLQVRLSAKLLWSAVDTVTGQQDIWPLLAELHEQLASWFAWNDWRLTIQISQVHICADIAGWDLEKCFDWQATMLTRARRRVPRASFVTDDLPVCQECSKLYGGNVPQDGSFLWQGPETEVPTPIYSGHHLETIEFGSHGSSLSCVIYNKSREIKKSGKTWVPDIWKRHGYSGEGDVWRIEFRLGREFLRDIKQEGVFHGIETVADLRAYLPYLWSYCAGHTMGGDDGYPDGWLRHVVPNGDENVGRWPLHPAWTVVQSAFCTDQEQAVDVTTGEVVDVPRSPLAVLIRQRHRQRNIARLVQQIAGCSSTLAAHLGGRKEDALVDLSADTAADVVPMPEQIPDMDLPMVLNWLQQNAARYALKKKLPRETPDDVRQQAYDMQFEESVLSKRVLYAHQSTEE